MNIKVSDEQIINAVNNPLNLTMRMVLREVKLCETSGKHYERVYSCIRKYNLKNSHWIGGARKKGRVKGEFGRYYPLGDYLKLNGRFINSCPLKNRLFDEGIKKKFCEQCDNSLWNGKPIFLELHHKNGNPKDNRVDNLQILCLNCHAQTDTYRTKNRKF